jgi:hypothetical protein
MENFMIKYVFRKLTEDKNGNDITYYNFYRFHWAWHTRFAFWSCLARYICRDESACFYRQLRQPYQYGGHGYFKPYERSPYKALRYS